MTSVGAVEEAQLEEIMLYKTENWRHYHVKRGVFLSFHEVMLSAHLGELKLLILIVLRCRKRVMQQVTVEAIFSHFGRKLYRFMNLALPLAHGAVPDADLPVGIPSAVAYPVTAVIR